MSKPKPIYKDSTSILDAYVLREMKAVIPVTNPAATKTSSKQVADDKAKELVTKTLASLGRPNSANRPYGTGDTIASTGGAMVTVGQVNITSGKGQVVGEATFLEARARTYQTKIGVGAEAQAGLMRVEYGASWDNSLAKTSGGNELFGAGAQVKGEFYAGTQVNAEAGAGMKKGLPSAQAGVSAFAGVRIGITAGGEVRVLGLGLRASGTAQAWAGAQGSASVSANPAGVSAEVEGFAGAEASAQGTVSLAGIGVTGEADAYAGAGGKAGVTIGYKDGNIIVDAKLGAALGIGAGGEVGVSVNLEQLVGDGEAFFNTAGELLGDAADAVGGAASDAASDAGDVVAAVVNDAEQAVDAVASFFGF